MRKLIIVLAIFLSLVMAASAQTLPSFQFGIKGGANLSSISSPASSTFTSSNQAGYLGGLWARFGALGFNFQPELYITSKNVTVSENGIENKAKFTSIDVPLLIGGKVGALGVGGRFYTGPVVSFKINKDQPLGTAAQNITALNYKGQNFAWQFGAGLDIESFSIDLRYELGLTEQDYGVPVTNTTKINLFSLSLAYRLVKF